MSLIDQAEKRVQKMQEALRLRRDRGLSSREISRRTGLTDNTLRKLFRSEKEQLSTCRFKVEWTPDMDAMLRELRADMRSYLYCGDKIGVSAQTAKRRCEFLGLPMRGRGYWRKAA